MKHNKTTKCLSQKFHLWLNSFDCSLLFLMFIDTNNKLSLLWFGLVWLLTASYLKFCGSMFFFDNQNQLFCFMCYSIAITWDSCQKFAVRAKNFQSAESKPELSPNEEVLLNSCLSCSLLWHRSHNTLLLCFITVVHLFNTKSVHFSLGRKWMWPWQSGSQWASPEHGVTRQATHSSLCQLWEECQVLAGDN